MYIIEPYISKGVKISQSRSHPGIFILSYPDGGFCTISLSPEVIKITHPVDRVEIFKQHDVFKFNRTSNYVPQKMNNFKPQKL